ncbi:hypothetical protein [Sulfurovum mangrovi]|uniref:hypothetical protein n=1 Tax=Sulfurovum mangrovi TaxID=2893889 RepID=UPI001E650D7E|nr:hypothetical protein [Sulfurovum mangrovi]UFH60474.1 hypothetical protein LN246_06350 [Sulfurovum mangrovi]
MKKLSSLLIMLSVIVFANTTFPDTNKMNNPIQQASHKQVEDKKLAKRGCCSHHGGVCGCNDSGRQVCCDGTLSPTCTCNHSTPLPEQIH